MDAAFAAVLAALGGPLEAHSGSLISIPAPMEAHMLSDHPPGEEDNEAAYNRSSGEEEVSLRYVLEGTAVVDTEIDIAVQVEAIEGRVTADFLLLVEGTEGLRQLHHDPTVDFVTPTVAQKTTDALWLAMLAKSTPPPHRIVEEGGTTVLTQPPQPSQHHHHFTDPASASPSGRRRGSVPTVQQMLTAAAAAPPTTTTRSSGASSARQQGSDDGNYDHSDEGDVGGDPAAMRAAIKRRGRAAKVVDGGLNGAPVIG